MVTETSGEDTQIMPTQMHIIALAGWGNVQLGEDEAATLKSGNNNKVGGLLEIGLGTTIRRRRRKDTARVNFDSILDLQK